MRIDKTKIKNSRLVISLCFFFIPIVICTLVMWAKGCKLSDVYLPSGDGTLNDEMFYYQMVNTDLCGEDVKGYFGYNESHAQIGNHGAWSPAREWIWVAMGKVFGWHRNSPWRYNILMMSVALLIYAMVTEASWKTFRNVFLLFGSSFWIIKTMLSGLSEVSVYCLLIVFLAFAEKWLRNDKRIKISEMVFVYSLLTMLFLMRPYFAVFMLVYFYLVRESMNKYVLGGLAVFTGIIYVPLYKLFNNAMVAPLVSGSYVSNTIANIYSSSSKASLFLRVDDILEDFRYRYLNALIELIDNIRVAFTTDSLNMSYVYSTSYVMSLILFVELIILVHKRRIDKQYKTGVIIWLVSSFVIFSGCAPFMSFYIEARHLTFIGVVLSLLLANEKLNGKKFVALNTILGVIIVCATLKNYPESIYVYSDIKEGDLITIESILAADGQNENPWDYTIDWDFGAEGDEPTTDYTYLYGLPNRFGVNLCHTNYIRENFNNLQAKYVYTGAYSTVADLCNKDGKKLLYTNQVISIYKLR